MFFFIIPVTSKLFLVEEVDTIELRPAPLRTEIIEDEEEDEEIYEEPKNKVVEQEVEEIQIPVPVPQVVTPPAAPLKLELSSLPSPSVLSINRDIKTDLDFKEEVISDLSHETLVEEVKQAVEPVRPQVQVIQEGTFDEDAVDKKATFIKKKELVLPRRVSDRIRDRRLSGKVIIRCIIDKNGNLTMPKIISTGYIEKYCLEILPFQKLEAATKDGRKVAQYIDLEFEYGRQRR